MQMLKRDFGFLMFHYFLATVALIFVFCCLEDVQQAENHLNKASSWNTGFFFYLCCPKVIKWSYFKLYITLWRWQLQDQSQTNERNTQLITTRSIQHLDQPFLWSPNKITEVSDFPLKPDEKRWGESSGLLLGASGSDPVARGLIALKGEVGEAFLKVTCPVLGMLEQRSGWVGDGDERGRSPEHVAVETGSSVRLVWSQRRNIRWWLHSDAGGGVRWVGGQEGRGGVGWGGARGDSRWRTRSAFKWMWAPSSATSSSVLKPLLGLESPFMTSCTTFEHIINSLCQWKSPLVEVSLASLPRVDKGHLLGEPNA